MWVLTFQRRLILYHIVPFVSTGNFHSVKMFISLSALSLCDEGYYIRCGCLLQGVFEFFWRQGSEWPLGRAGPRSGMKALLEWGMRNGGSGFAANMYEAMPESSIQVNRHSGLLIPSHQSLEAPNPGNAFNPTQRARPQSKKGLWNNSSMNTKKDFRFLQIKSPFLC